MEQQDPFDLEALQRAEQSQKRLHAERARLFELDVQWAMQTREGRRLIWGLLRRGWAFGDPFDRDALVMARNTGRQAFARSIQDTVLRVALPHYQTMVDEAKRDDDAVERAAS